MSGGSAAYCGRSVHEHKTRPGDPIRQHILWSYIYIYIKGYSQYTLLWENATIYTYIEYYIATYIYIVV